MLEFILLTVIPAISSLVLGFGAVRVLGQMRLTRRLNPALSVVMDIGLIGFSLSVGALIGLVVALLINQKFYAYQALTKALPSGIYLWYGFGPGLTPQFYGYWRFVVVVIAIALPVLVLWNQQRRRSILLSGGQ